MPRPGLRRADDVPGLRRPAPPGVRGDRPRAHAAFPEAAIIQVGVRVIDDDGAPVDPLGDKVKRALRPRVDGPTELGGERLAPSLLRGNWLYWPSLVFRTERVQAYPFRDGLPIIQDLALVIDMVAAGETLVLDPTVCFSYRRHTGSASATSLVHGGGCPTSAATTPRPPSRCAPAVGPGRRAPRSCGGPADCTPSPCCRRRSGRGRGSAGAGTPRVRPLTPPADQRVGKRARNTSRVCRRPGARRTRRPGRGPAAASSAIRSGSVASDAQGRRRWRRVLAGRSTAPRRRRPRAARAGRRPAREAPRHRLQHRQPESFGQRGHRQRAGAADRGPPARRRSTQPIRSPSRRDRGRRPAAAAGPRRVAPVMTSRGRISASTRARPRISPAQFLWGRRWPLASTQVLRPHRRWRRAVAAAARGTT